MTRQRLANAVLVSVILAFPTTAATLHVPKDHKTIQEAIDAAAPGDTVLVQPGAYPERLRLKDRVTVQSAGDDAPGKLGLKRAEATRIEGGGAEAKGSAVTLAEGAVLDGFTITRVGAFNQKEYDDHYATRGENLPDERGAVGVGNVFPAVAIPPVTAVVRNNIVCDNGHPGIGCVGAEGKRNASVIARNVVFRNMGGGIGISSGARPTVEANRCYNNLRGGIGNRNSSAVIRNNECYDNVRAGIGVREGATPMIRGNKCHNNRRAGIGCRMEGTSPLVEDNDCYENGMAGIGSRDGASPLIRGNRCYDNLLAGIGSRDGARPVITGNKCYRNKEAGIGIQLGAHALITSNECYENERAGIGQRSDAVTHIDGNHIHHNKAAGIGFDECKAGQSTVLHNKIIDNNLVAIGIHAGWTVRIAGNEISRAEGIQPLVMVFKGAKADIIHNTFRGTGVAGVRVEGVIRVCENQFTSAALRKVGPPQFAVWGLPGADIVFTDNTVKDWRHALSADSASVLATNNTVSGYWQAGIRLSQSSVPPVVTGNVFQTETNQPGVIVTGEQGRIENNRVEKPGPGK